jgi:L,D-transpeptidase ErfK/SrfK
MRLYPEDIAVFFDLIPIGTKVTVVNQPYLFGWRDGTLYFQAYAVMQDDSRNWSRDRKRLLASLLSPKLRGRIEVHGGEIDWQRVGDLARAPRAVPVSVTGGHDGIDAVIAQSLLVADVLPTGSNWDGSSGLLVDEKTFNELLNGRETPPAGAAAPGVEPSQAAVH